MDSALSLWVTSWGCLLGLLLQGRVGSGVGPLQGLASPELSVRLAETQQSLLGPGGSETVQQRTSQPREVGRRDQGVATFCLSPQRYPCLHAPFLLPPPVEGTGPPVQANLPSLGLEDPIASHLLGSDLKSPTLPLLTTFVPLEFQQTQGLSISKRKSVLSGPRSHRLLPANSFLPSSLSELTSLSLP